MSASPPKRLLVFIQGIHAGTLQQHANGSLRFSYEPSYRGSPLSLAMPRSNLDYGDKLVRPYLFGLLPDNPALRQALGREHGVSGNNPFDLLCAIGMDCPGAVQFCTEDDAALLTQRTERYEPLDDHAIGARLRALSQRVQTTWQAPDEHWSLGGQQSKIALACFDGRWYSCEGAAATTHILKPGIASLAHQALNEHVCLALANRCGIPAAESRFAQFDDESAIVVRRYDRIIEADKRVLRLHQEDCCQALGILPDSKYANEGGPSARDIVNLLKQHDRAEQNVLGFAAQLFYNYLIGAPDAHAKNYSVILLERGGPVLAPLYDVASGLPYDPPRGGWRCAMSIGGENRVGRVQRRHIEQFANMAGIDRETAISLFANIAEAILEHVEDAAQGVAALPGGQELAEHFVPTVGELCRKTLSFL